MNYNRSVINDISSNKVDLTRLRDEILNSTISPQLDNLRLNGDDLIISYTSNLTAEEIVVQDSILSAHSGEPYPEETAPQQVSVVEEIAPPPFANKALSTGQKLFKRIHGVQSTISANSTGTIQLTVPYTQAKINGLEIIGSSPGDTGNFNVYDNAAGTISTIPNYKLNQFGFNVCMRPEFHKEESKYDADVILGMVLELEFTNNQNTDQLIGVNFILHELV